MIDPAIIGTQIAEVTFPVDRSKAAELGRAFADTDPAWFDADAAAAAGFDGIPTMPTVSVIETHWLDGGVHGLVDAIGADLAKVLHGEAAWEYLVPVRVGDTLTMRQTVTGVTTRAGRRGGEMTLVTIECAYTNQRGELAQRRVDTLIERS